MKRLSLMVLLLLAALGYFALAYFFPRLNPMARWEYHLDRDSAISAAKAVAARHNFSVSGSKTYVAAAFDREAEYYLLHRSGTTELPLLPPVKTSVVFVTSTGDSFRVILSNTGRVLGFIARNSSAKGESPPPELTRETAAEGLREIVGNEGPQFTLVSESAQGKEGIRYIWERTLAAGLKVQIESLVSGPMVKEIILRPIFSSRTPEQAEAQHDSLAKPFDITSGVLFGAGLIAAFIFYLVGLTRKEVNNHDTLIILVAVSLFALLIIILGGKLDDEFASFYSKAIELPDNAIMRSSALPWIAVIMMVPMISIGVFIVWGAGQARFYRIYPEQAISIAAVLRGKLLSRAVGASITSGLLLGGIFGVIPYLVAATRLFPGIEMRQLRPLLLVAPSPAVACFDRPLSYSILTLFVFLLPLLGTYIRRPALARAVGLFVGWLWLADSNWYRTIGGYSTTGVAALLAGALLTVAAYLTFRRFDLLALLSAAFAANTALQAAALLVQPSPSLRQSGIWALSSLGLILVAAFAVAWKGREVDLEVLGPGRGRRLDGALQRADRDRLKAEFEVARRAQRQMIPISAPIVPGLDVSAICRPAREVGGDLYDFIPLPGGKLGIVVADVSGKGVPAALYMTLTKGLLVSVAEDRNDPGEILREVNRYLYDACRHRVFVTLTFGVVDQSSGILTYCRAGHNPPVLRRRTQGVTRMLQARGIGLGLNSGNLFDRNLAVESIPLEPGDCMFFYSDGITEAMNTEVEEYGEERLLAAVARTDGMTAEQSRDSVLQDVGNFLGPLAAQDDITLVVVQVQ